MSEPGPPLLLQVCANDHPPFAGICRYYAAAARSLSWRALTVMLESRDRARDPDFYYPDEPLSRCLADLLDDRQPVFALCHRYRAYRSVIGSGVIRSPVVAVAHEFGFLRRRRRRWQHRFDRLRGRAPVAFAGVSDAVRDELADATGDAVLLPNGIDLGRADGARLPRRQAREALGLGVEAFIVGVVGRLHRKKNPLLAMDGFARVADRMPDARLVFLGDGELADALAARVGGLPVTLCGFVPDAPALMAAFDVLLVPSGQQEAFGMVALEAMAAGVPVLCGPSPGPRFVAADTGRFFGAESADDLGETLLGAYRDWQSGALGTLASRARARVEREFSVPAGAGRLQALAVAQ